MSNARDRIAERVRNVYTSGYNDARADRADRMDDVADAETARILGVVKEALMEQGPLEAAADVWNNHHAPTCDRAIQAAWHAAFGADDDGGER